MSEFLEVLDESGLSQNKIASRLDVHTKGLWHSSAHIWIINNEGELLLQKRSKRKTLYPNTLVTPVSEHLEPGETAINAAIRGAKEELDIEITEKDLMKVGLTKDSYQNTALGIDEKEFIHHFVYKGKLPHIDLTLSNEEVDSLVWMQFTEFKRRVEQRDNGFVPAWKLYECFIEWYLEINSNT